MLKVSIVIGNPKPRSRTRLIAEKLVERILAPGSYELDVLDLADHAERLFSWPCEEMAALNASVAASNLIMVASPTYKATYTGLLKAFLDRYPANGLRGVVAIPLMTGADLTHSMGPSTHLVPLLGELGAITPVPGFYFVTSDMDRLDRFLDSASEQFNCAMDSLATIAAARVDDQTPKKLGEKCGQ